MENNKKPVFEAKGIKKTFYTPKPLPILKGVNLSLAPKEPVAIIGRSGEGKSTLLHILGTLDGSCEGSLFIGGKEVTAFNRASLRSQSIGFVFQSFHLLEDFTVLENVLMAARIARRSTKEGSAARNRVLELLEKVGLHERINHPVKLLSGGEKQRVAIARAMCNDPSVIFADEPSGNLDRTTAAGIHELLFNFCSEGKALVLVTHDQELAEQCHKRYELSDGKLHLIV